MSKGPKGLHNIMYVAIKCIITTLFQQSYTVHIYVVVIHKEPRLLVFQFYAKVDKVILIMMHGQIMNISSWAKVTVLHFAFQKLLFIYLFFWVVISPVCMLNEIVDLEKSLCSFGETKPTFTATLMWYWWNITWSFSVAHCKSLMRAPLKCKYTY